MLVFRNGFFNLRHWLAGKECFVPKTPRLFYQYQAPFEYAAQPEPPAVWLADQDAPLTWNDKQFGTELRTAIPAIERRRLSSGADTHYNGAAIVKTDFDSDSSRPWVYVGIAPKPEHCKVVYNY